VPKHARRFRRRGGISTVIDMGRKRRVQARGLVLHVTTRGNNRERIFLRDGDYLAILLELERVVERYGWICHAYCLMGNHVHFMIELVETTLPEGMQQLQSKYARGFNKRYGRTGHVFGNRYFSLPVVDDSHLLELCRYIVLNPVRAGACRAPEDWPWSSYSATIGIAPRPAFLTVDWILDQFGRDEEDARRQYARFVGAGLAVV
jgi:REP-associated tyrosine transposase